MWLLHMTLFSLIQLIKLSQLSISLEFCQKCKFLERQKTKVSASDISYNFFCSC